METTATVKRSVLSIISPIDREKAAGGSEENALHGAGLFVRDHGDFFKCAVNAENCSKSHDYTALAKMRPLKLLTILVSTTSLK